MQAILGQLTAIETLGSAIENGRVHHAWIFHGPLGVGKFSTAIDFAKLLLEPNPERDLAGNISVDPNSRISKMVAEQTHPDLHIIRKELALDSTVAALRTRKLSSIPIDLLREHMIGGTTTDDKQHEPIVYHTPSMNHAKVFIIDEAELLAPIGQNAILKTLEEPAVRTYIILITTQIDRLLPTIRSRCQRVGFVPLNENDMQTWLKRQTFDDDLSDYAVQWLLSFAEGSPGLFELAIRDDLYHWHQQLLPVVRALSAGKFNADAAAIFNQLADDYATAWVKKNPNSSKDVANKDGAQRVLMLLSTYARQGLQHSLNSETADPELWLKRIDAIRACEKLIFTNVNQKMAMENLAAQWTNVGLAVNV